MVKNIIMISVDCLREDIIKMDKYNRFMPFLNSLKRKSIYFSNSFANGIPTFFSFPSIFTGKYPFYNGRKVGIINEKETLVEFLKEERNFNTFCFNAANPHLSAMFGYNKGFDYFEDYLDCSLKDKFKKIFISFLRELGISHIFDFDLNGKKMTSDILRKMRKKNHVRNMFLWVHFMDAHSPYFSGFKYYNELFEKKVTFNDIKYFKKSYREKWLKERKIEKKGDAKFYFNMYLSSLYYVDIQIERIFNFVKKLDGETLFMVFADHGDLFMENGRIHHDPYDLTNYVIKAPVLIHDSNLYERKRSGLEMSNSFELRNIYKIVKDFSDGKEMEYPNYISDGTIFCESLYGMIDPVSRKQNPKDFEIIVAAIKDNFKVVKNLKDNEKKFYEIKNDNFLEQEIKAEEKSDFLKEIEKQINEFLKTQKESEKNRLKNIINDLKKKKKI